MGDAHLSQVVEVGAEPDRRLGMFVHSERPRHGYAATCDALAMAEGVAIARLDRLPPLAHHRQVGGLELSHLTGDVDQVDARLEPPEEAVRRVQKGERILIAAHRLVEEGEFARRLGLVQPRTCAPRHLYCRPEPRFGERGAARLAVHHSEDAIGLGLVAQRVELIEDGERGFRLALRVCVALPQDVHVGVVDQAQALQVDVPCPLGDLVALPEIALRFIQLLEVRAHHAEVVIGDRAAVLVVRRAVGLEGSPVACLRFVEVPLDVREDAEVLLDARAECAALPAQL